MRFPGFTDEWERVKLCDIADRITRKNKNLETERPLTISAQYGLIDQEDFFNKVVASNNLANYYMLKRGEFAYNKSYSSDYPWGAIKRLDLYDAGALSTLYICFNPKDKIDSDFLVHYFESPKWYLEVANIAGEGARNHGLLNISVVNFFQTQHYKPKQIEEQRKIAKLLDLISDRIATQNKIIEDLKQLRTAIIDRYLCAESSRHLRLGDVGIYVRGLTYSADDVVDDRCGTAIYRANNLDYGDDVNDSNLVYVSKTPTNNQVLSYGDIVICMANGSSQLVGKNSFYASTSNQATVGAFCGIYRTDFPLAKWYMQSSRYKRMIYHSIQGGNGAIANLNGDDILSMKFPLRPQDEISSLSDLLKGWDERIRCNERLLTLYERQRKFLLSSMFI